jgi:hypothetical protein
LIGGAALALLAGASALPVAQRPGHWHLLVAPALLALLTGAGALLAPSSRPLVWTGLLLCAEETLALEFGKHSAYGWTLAFAVLLSAGLELAYWASARFYGRAPLARYARALLPTYALAAGAAALLTLLSHSYGLNGLGLVLVGLAAALVLLIVLATVTIRKPRRE